MGRSVQDENDPSVSNTSPCVYHSRSSCCCFFRFVGLRLPLLPSLHRDALTELFVALGLRSREVGVDGESGFGIPDTGGQDSEHVIKKVGRGVDGSGMPGLRKM